MGSGCLRPPPALGQIDFSILDAIYEDIRDMQLPTHHSEYRNLKIYQQIRQRISKKGQLKKLCDYLSSHRSRICQTVLHSYRITNQSKIYSYKYVAIIVMEAIFNSVPKIRTSLENYALSGNSSFRQSMPRKLVSSEKEVSYQEIIHSKKNATQSSEMQQTKPLPKSVSNMQYEITSYKFQGIYFNFVSILLKQGGLIYRLCLENLIKFCEFSDSFFSNETQVQQIMKIINYHLQTNDNLGISLKTYSAMLCRLRQSYFTQDIDMLKVFFNLWSTNPNSIATTQSENFTPLQISELCTKIIQIFIKKCVESYHYDIIVEVLFQILDENNFKNVNKVQNILFESIEELELKNQFNKYLMIYLMAYVGFPQNIPKGNNGMNLRLYSKTEDEGQNQQQGQNTNIFQKQWTDCFKMGNADTFKKKFKNILLPQCKLNSIPTICIWIIQNHLAEMSQLLTYSGVSLIYSYAFNMIGTPQQVKDKSISQLLHLINKMERQYKIKILELIMSQLEESPIFDDGVRYILLNISQSIIDKQKQWNICENTSHIIQSINSHYCFENNRKIVQLMGKIFIKLTKECTAKYLQRICEFYKQLYTEISDGYTNSEQKVLLLEELNNFGKFPPYHKGISIAFLEVVENSIEKQNSPDGTPEISLLFLDLLFVKIWVRNQNLQNYVMVLKQKKDYQKITLLEEYSKDRVSMNLDIPMQQRRNLQFYNESVLYFKKRHHKDSQTNIPTLSIHWKGFQSVNSNRDSVYTKGDRDLEDVLDILKFD